MMSRGKSFRRLRETRSKQCLRERDSSYQSPLSLGLFLVILLKAHTQLDQLDCRLGAQELPEILNSFPRCLL